MPWPGPGDTATVTVVSSAPARPARVTVVSGPSGAGKSTVAAVLAHDARRPTVLVTTDDFFRAVATGGVAPFLPEAQRQNETVVDAVVAAVGAYARGGYDVVVDGVVGPWFLDRYRAAAAGGAWDLDYVVLRPARDVALARGAARGDGELRDPDALGAIHDGFADLGALEPHALDTTGHDADETARVVRAALDAGRYRLAVPSPPSSAHAGPDRTEPSLRADETATLRAYLGYHRDTLRWKTAGLTAAQLRTPLPPSTMTLGGLLKHLAYVESQWFAVVLDGGDARPPFDTVDWAADPDWEWHSAAADDPADLRALFDDAVAASDRALDRLLGGAPSPAAGLDVLSVREDRHGGGRFSLRWVLVHLIEEYARHNGHADLLREALDGATGE